MAGQWIRPITISKEMHVAPVLLLVKKGIKHISLKYKFHGITEGKAVFSLFMQ